MQRLYPPDGGGSFVTDGMLLNSLEIARGVKSPLVPVR